MLCVGGFWRRKAQPLTTVQMKSYLRPSFIIILLLALNLFLRPAVALVENQSFGIFGVTPVSTQPAAAAQAAITVTSTDATAGAAADLTALKAEAEKIGDDVRALTLLVHSIRTALVNLGLIKGGA
jgi:hypothetical protein